MMDLGVEERPAPPMYEPLIIRYEGRLAAEHEIELGQLGESLQGFAKAIAATAHFAETGDVKLHFDALAVRVVATPVQEHHCFEVWATVKPIVESKEFWAGAVGAAATVFAPVLTYILSSRKAEEMKHLSDALKQSMAGNHQVTEKLVTTIEKLAEALNPSVRKALSPIDKSCSHIDLYERGQHIQTMDTETKAAYASAGSRVSDNTTVLSGTIIQFNMNSGACQVVLDGMSEPVGGKVLDPIYGEPNNPYAVAMTSAQPLTFLAKYESDAEGRVVKLYILDTASQNRGD